MKTPDYNLFSFDLVLIDCHLLAEAFLDRLKLKWPCPSLSCTPLALLWHLPSSANTPSAHFTHCTTFLSFAFEPLLSLSSPAIFFFPTFFPLPISLLFLLLSPFLCDHPPLYFKVLEGIDLFIFSPKLLETPLLKLNSFLLALFKATLMIPIRASSATPGSQTER